MDRGRVGNGCGPNRRIGHGYDRSLQAQEWPKESYISEYIGYCLISLG